MKKVLLVVLAGVLATPFFVSAQTVTDQFTNDTQVQNGCLDLHYNMAYRSRDTQTNGEVSDLQDFLVTNGYLSGDPTGYFGVATLVAVKKFQSANGLGSPTTPGYGSVGPKSRSKIKGMTCGGSSTPTVSVNTPTITTTTTATANSGTNSNLPVGCKSEAGFSYISGVRCATVSPQNTNPVYPAGCASSSGYSQTTGQACSAVPQTITTPVTTSVITPSINITQPVHGMYKTGSIITVGWNENYAASAITATLMNSVTGAQSYSTSFGPGVTGNNYANIPTSISSNLPPARYTLSVCDMNTPNPAVSFKPLCSSTQFMILPVSAVMTNLPFGCSVNASWDETLDRACFGGTTTVTSSNTLVNAVDSSVLKIVYSSTTGEAGLTAIFNNVSVTAGSTDFKIYKYGAFDTATYAFMVTLNNARGANGATTNPTYYKASGSATDNGTYWVIPAGQTASFNLSANLSNPKALFAGSYNATLSLYKPSGVSDSVAPSLVGHIYTPYVSVIGETSPYITSVSASTGGTSPIYSINGIRFEYTSNNVTINGVTKVLPSADTRTINFTPSDFSIASAGDYLVQVVSPTQGASNKAYALINNPGSTAVAPKVSSASIIGAQTSYSAGTIIKFSVKGVTTDGSSADPSRNFNVQSSMRMLDPIQTYLPVYVNGVAQSFNASYNQSTGYWDVTMTAPSDTTKTYDVDTAVYCANSAQGCQSSQVNAGFRFNVTSGPAIKVSLPAASLSFDIGQPGAPLTVNWEEVGFTPQSMQVMFNGTTNGFASIVLANLGSSNQTSFVGTIPTVSTGSYTISVCDNGTSSPVAPGKPLCGTSAQFGITAPVIITTPGTPVITSATTINATQADAQNYLVSWQAVSGATTYKMKIDNLAIQDIGYTTSWGFNVKAGLPTSLSLLGTHTINIQACNTTVCSGWSNTVTENVTAPLVTTIAPTLKTVEPTAQNVTPNTAGMKMGSFSVTAGSDGIRVKTVNVTIGLNGYSMTNLSNLVVKSGGIVLGTPLGSPSLVNPQVFSFTPVDILVGQTKTFDVYADVGSATSGFASVIISILYGNTISGVEGTLNANAATITTSASVVAIATSPSNQMASVLGAFSTDPAPSSSTVAKWTYSWVNNLEIGSSYTNDVSALQTALTKEGVYTGEITGGFYTQTYLAVKALQAKYGIESTGFVGPETRTKLNALFGAGL